MKTTWKIESVERDANSGLINKVSWALSVSDDTHETVIRENAVLAPSETFIEFDLVTEAQVIDWVKETLGEGNVSAFEALAEETFNYEKDLVVDTPAITPIAYGSPESWVAAE